MNIIGISAFYHDAACCLLQHGQLLAAVSEERFSRIKNDSRLPVHAFRHCLHAGNLSIMDVDRIAYYESPTLKLSRQLWSGRPAGAGDDFAWLDANAPIRAIREHLGFDGPIDIYQHHQSHAASSFYYAGFEQAAVFTVDGVGEWATTTYGMGDGDNLQLFHEVTFPHSLGLFYATLTAYLGFKVNSGEYKVMGLAPYGQPRYADILRDMVLSKPGGDFELNMDYFDFVSGQRMFSDHLIARLGRPPRAAESAITSFHQDVACSLQRVLEEVLLEKVRWLATQVDSDCLCLAGGVALNCVANGRIARETPFQHIFIQPAAGDAGGCLGAAALSFREQQGQRHTREPLPHVYLGPRFDPNDVQRRLQATGLAFDSFAEAELIDTVADALAANHIVGWFQGAMEFGPRALGARSILANPADPSMRQRLNDRIKKREAFRPFAPVVQAEVAHQWFDLSQPSPFMLQVCQVTAAGLPAITHVDGSARPQTVTAEQNPRLHALLSAFQQRTGYPMLVNTSFNVRGEPIVCTPDDALFCMGVAGLDLLVIENCVVHRSALPADWSQRFHAWRYANRPQQRSQRNMLYTFV